MKKILLAAILAAPFALYSMQAMQMYQVAQVSPAEEARLLGEMRQLKSSLESLVEKSKEGRLTKVEVDAVFAQPSNLDLGRWEQVLREVLLNPQILETVKEVVKKRASATAQEKESAMNTLYLVNIYGHLGRLSKALSK